ncbi:hypothetical protein L202_07719 [Cryptococcus amylolentus CBS 6039]|uniref:Uncharacterized protein n=1 Tax=Cryptococcus amylolentus CBS 6039 TaxID=1295533 RepID=A0A1E3H9X2_9TREE|nr:hypothetical protein L202_07719 [Cryptococcus amylolentus CBS 6039]ODN73152.1 hypothetical protein L202_07719 [Cryptococcus amylolentus CBS 6039]
MSKPKSKSSAPPPLGGQVPSPFRTSSQQNVNAQSSPKFYNGPTVASKPPTAKDKAVVAGTKATAVAKTLQTRTVAKVRRHPWGFVSLLSTIPFLIIISLASTVLCPPPGTSAVNKYLLSPLGYPEHQSHPILCYPANVYNAKVLQPYVYPVLDDLQAKVITSSPYVNYVEPASVQAQRVGVKLWNGPVKPVVTRIQRGIRRFYLTFVEPHIPYLNARYHTFVDPYTTRISALTAPHLASARAYAAQAGANAYGTYQYAASHPYTGHASRYAQQGYKVGSQKGFEAYKWSRPHAIRAGEEVRRIATQVLGPRAVKAAEVAFAQIDAAWKIVKAQACAQYRSHLEPHVAPHLKTAATVAAPYYALYNKHIHTPYVQPAYQSVFPPTKEPKTFLKMLADWLPTSGLTAAETRGGLDDYFADVQKAKKGSTGDLMLGEIKPKKGEKIVKAEAKKPKVEEKPKKVEVPEAKVVAEDNKRWDRATMNDAIKTFRAKVDEQGKTSEKQVKKELREHNEGVVQHTLPEFATNMRSEVDKEIEYVLKGLDRLYTQSPTLTRDQVKDSSDKADERVGKSLDKIKARLDLVKNRVHGEAKPIVKGQFDVLDTLLGAEYVKLAEHMSWVDDITVKDWDKYHEIRKLASAWKDKYIALHEEPTTFKPFAELRTELSDIHEGFRTRLGILKRTAVDRIEAREEVEAAKKENAKKIKEKKPEPGKVSILPVVEGAGAAAAGIAGAGGVIGKGKEQVLSALSAASPTPTAGYAAQAQSSAESILSAASQSVHEATRSAYKAVGGTPSPESPREYAESAYGAASLAAADVLAQASKSLDAATKSAIRAAGGTASPESPKEHLESVYKAASEGLEALAVGAAGAAHEATRSASRAVGATPTPESIGESYESVVAAASSASQEVVGAAGKQARDASKAAVKAVGGTPSPESPAEHVESAYHAATDQAASIASDYASSASVLASEASASVHSATRSALSAAGAQPTPESAEEYLESIAGVVQQGAASVYSVAGENVHDATRSVVRAAGGTPTPETPGEHAESLYNAASEGVVDAADAVTEQAARIYTGIQEALGVVSTPTPLASSASSYLASVASEGSSTAAEALATGSSILSSLQSEASVSLHSATRSASSALGATPSPESPGEYKDAAVEQALSARRAAESLVRKHAGQIKKDLEAEGKTFEDYRHDHAAGGVGHNHGHGHEGHGHAHDEL